MFRPIIDDMIGFFKIIKMFKKLILGLLIFSIIMGCVVPNFKGLKSDYKKLSQDEKAKVVKFQDELIIKRLLQDDTIYSISSKPIENYISIDKEDVVIYIWSPNCSSPYCYPIEYVQEICSRRDQKLIVIIEYFDMSQIRTQKLDVLEFPLFSIDTEFYGTDFCNKYVNLFICDLLNMNELPDEIRYKNYFLFSEGKFVKAINDIVKIEKNL